MKNLIKIIAISVAFLGLTFNVSAQDKDKQADRISNSDRFLSLVLSKAEKYSEKAEEGISKAVDVISEETPKVIEEFLVWRAWKAGIIGFGWLAIAIFGGGGLLFLLYKKNVWEAAPLLIFPTVPMVFGIDYILEFIQIMVAPRVYIIEQAIQLIK